AEKKPLVVDTRRCWGPFMVSIDKTPLVVLDACSQIATLTHGFAHPDILRELHSGKFSDCLWRNPDTAVEQVRAVEAYADAVRCIAPQELEHVSLVCAGGAEANEKALRIARLHAPAGRGRNRVLAFQGGFHGRMFAALMATWNPVKRAAFELPGYEAVFCPTDLEQVAATLEARGKELYAIIIEPMMSEGGDIHLAAEFFRGLVKLARAHKLPLIVDEVQTGFGTGGTPLWWQRLGLTDDPEATPDLMTVAKKAALGVVLSRWPDPERAFNQVHVASAVRGHIQLSTSEEMAELELPLAEELQGLAARFPETLSNPRVAGCTFAFELPTTELKNAFIAQRLQRGFMTYGAGVRTIRFRLNAQFSRKEISRLFVRIAATIERLTADDASTWISEGSRPGGVSTDPKVILREITSEDWPAIMEIEHATYEPERCDSETYLRRCEQGGVGFVAVDTADGAQTIVGFCTGAPLEKFADVGGPDRDPRLNRGDTF
ncbi:MAG: aminotransferase class III-fold pyridoxal phosphate-dependent enzyme, partial [Nannocystaceae bacterium]